MSAAAAVQGLDPSLVDQRVYLYDVPWEEYEALLQTRGESSTPRITYLKGTVELMAPSRYHELDKTKLARLIETWADERGVALEGYGSWTVKNRAQRRGAEADESYVIGSHDPDAITAPHIAIEVIWTSGGIEKLEVWRKLGVREVWIWQDGSLQFHVLRGGKRFETAERSELLPELDPKLLVEPMSAPTQREAIARLRRALRG